MSDSTDLKEEKKKKAKPTTGKRYCEEW